MVRGSYQDTPALKTLAAIAKNLLNVEVGEFIAYLYDENEEMKIQSISISLIEIGIKELQDTDDIVRALNAVSAKVTHQMHKMRNVIEEGDKDEIERKFGI